MEDNETIGSVNSTRPQTVVPHSRSLKWSKDAVKSLMKRIEQRFQNPKSKEDKHDALVETLPISWVTLKIIHKDSLVEKIINDALFMVEMNQLTMSHSICDGLTCNPAHSPQPDHLNGRQYLTTRNYYELSSPSVSLPATSHDCSSDQSTASYFSQFNDGQLNN